MRVVLEGGRQVFLGRLLTIDMIEVGRVSADS